MSLSADIQKLYDELQEDDSVLDNLDENQLTELRKKYNPYGKTIEGSQAFCNLSVTYLKEKYLTKFHTTGLIAFLYRMLNEWNVPDGVPVVSVHEYLKNPTQLDLSDEELKRATDTQKREYAENKEFMEKYRLPAAMFLEHMFQFNPDEHVRSAHRPNTQDPTRKKINTPAGLLAKNHLKKIDKKFKAEMDKKDKIDQVRKTKTKMIKIKDKKGRIKVIKKEVPIDDNKLDERPSWFNTPKISELLNEMDPELRKNAVDPLLPSTTREIIPPQDIFHRYNHYVESNFEALRNVVNDLYCEKPDIELAINPYSWSSSLEEAEKFKRKHKNEVITDIFTCTTSKWNLIGPFSQNRDRINFYNEKTVVIEEILRQTESDARLGAELMKKRIHKKKKQNIAEAGPDDPSFARFRKENQGALESMGAEAVNVGDMASEDCPDDAVEADVLSFSGGGRNLKKSKIYIEAEAPELPDTKDNH